MDRDGVRGAAHGWRAGAGRPYSPGELGAVIAKQKTAGRDFPVNRRVTVRMADLLDRWVKAGGAGSAIRNGQRVLGMTRVEIVGYLRRNHECWWVV